jgi:hypothetical protein
MAAAAVMVTSDVIGAAAAASRHERAEVGCRGYHGDAGDGAPMLAGGLIVPVVYAGEQEGGPGAPVKRVESCV